MTAAASKFAAQNAQLDTLFNKVVQGKADPSIALAAAGVINAKTRRQELQIKTAVKGNFVKELIGQWRTEHLGPPA